MEIKKKYILLNLELRNASYCHSVIASEPAGERGNPEVVAVDTGSFTNVQDDKKEREG